MKSFKQKQKSTVLMLCIICALFFTVNSCKDQELYTNEVEDEQLLQQPLTRAVQEEVYTPNGTRVTNVEFRTGYGSSMDNKTSSQLESIFELPAGSLNDNFYEEVAGSHSLNTYNCYGFAFYMKGDQYHAPATIMDPDQYYNDYSYILTGNNNTPVGAEIVRYEGHTAVIPVIPTNPSQDVWVLSKWGGNGLYYHRVDMCPYHITNNFKAYYKKNPAFINPTGDTSRNEGYWALANSNNISVSFYNNGILTNANWSVIGSGISIVGNSSNTPTVTITRTSSSSGTAKLQATSTSGGIITQRVFQLPAISTPPTPVISGPTSVCTSATFSATNWQSGYSWVKSSNLINISNPSSSSTTISVANSISNGAYSVSVKNSSGTTLATYSFWVGLPILSAAWPSSDEGRVGEPVEWMLMPYYPQFHEITIEAYKGSTYVYGYRSGNGHYIEFDEPGNYTILTYSSNSCGLSPPLYHYNFHVYGYSMSLNPRSNELEITIDDGESGKSLAASNFTVTISDSNKASRSQSSYSGSNFKVPVSSLPDGTYTVNISNGKTSKTTELVIKR